MAINPINILVEKFASILMDITKTKLERLFPNRAALHAVENHVRSSGC